MKFLMVLEYYNTKRGKNFLILIFKNINLIFFHSLFQAKLCTHYNKDIFDNDTFYVTLEFKLFYIYNKKLYSRVK